jgi:hypothetical protein
MDRVLNIRRLRRLNWGNWRKKRRFKITQKLRLAAVVFQEFPLGRLATQFQSAIKSQRQQAVLKKSLIEGADLSAISGREYVIRLSMLRLLVCIIKRPVKNRSFQGSGTIVMLIRTLFQYQLAMINF